MGCAAHKLEGRLLTTLSRRDGGIDPFDGIAAKCYRLGTIGRRRRSSTGPPILAVPALPVGSPRFWFDKTVEAAELLDPAYDHPLLGYRQRGHPARWLNHLDQQVLPGLATTLLTD